MFNKYFQSDKTLFKMHITMLKVILQ